MISGLMERLSSMEGGMDITIQCDDSVMRQHIILAPQGRSEQEELYSMRGTMETADGRTYLSCTKFMHLHGATAKLPVCAKITKM